MSDEKGSTSGYLSSDCSGLCPQHCLGTWKTFENVDDPWEIDDTLLVEGKGNKGSM